MRSLGNWAPDGQPGPTRQAVLPRRALVGGLLGAALHGTARADGSAGPPKTVSIADGVADFGDALVRKLGLNARADGYVVSPGNLHATLSLLALGARGRTREAFARRLGFASSSPGAMAAALRDARTAIASLDSERTHTSIAYSGWSRQGHPFNPAWRNNAGIAAAPHLGQLDFGARSSVPAINAWVAAATGGQVPVAVDRLDPGTELVLAGAIFFAGSWEYAFPEANTAPRRFHRADGAATEAAMMANDITVGYGERGLGHVVRIPYQGDRMALWVAAARRPDDSAAFAAELADAGVARWVRDTKLMPRLTSVMLPRMSLAAGGEMLPTLRQIGYGAVLDGDFGALLDGPLRPTQIAHQARIRIDETGTVAAASTVIAASRAMPAQMAVFSADRPFAFVLGSSEPWLPLFAGYVGDASKIS